jgi:hypothetical protein
VILSVTNKIRTKIGTWYRLFYQTLLWEDSCDFSTVDQFINYVLLNNEDFGLSNCSGSVKCLGGQVFGDIEDGTLYILGPISQFVFIICYNFFTHLFFQHKAHFFVAPCPINQDEKIVTFDLFVISFTHGRDLDNYFFAKDSVYAKKFSHHIFDQAKKTVIEILNKASIQFRRDQMWVEQSDWV